VRPRPRPRPSRAGPIRRAPVEHGNLIETSGRLMAENGMFLVANLVTYYA